jgi:hypothetical protein
MEALKKILLILFCGTFFVVRQKMVHDIEKYLNRKISYQATLSLDENPARGEFAKK